VGRIRVLSDNVANKIAAGEVVERPASVVKELLENSFDAGAARVRIEAESGGRRLIRVTDDGSGMVRDDALLAFERHATSKLADVKDLDNIATLGFRGEALPSIAAVSRLTLETRSESESTGVRVEISGGKLMRCDEAALARGTVVSVRDLFFNVPARRKFLRSDQTELAHIATLATHYSLAYPERAVELFHDGKELLNVTPVETIAERVFQVFGSQSLDELIDLGAVEREAPAGEGEDPAIFLLRGFVSPPQVQKSSRNSIYLFVNGRLIRDRLLLHALNSAYHSLMPSNAFPFALLFLNCCYEEVDVNVHPSKTEVRFRRGSFVHDFVRDAVRQALLAARPVPAASGLSLERRAQPAADMPYSEFTRRLENQPWLPPAREPVPTCPADAGGVSPFSLRAPVDPAAPRFDFGTGAFGTGAAADSPLPPVDWRVARVPDTHGPLPPGLAAEPAPSLDALRDLRPLGQLHDSFIVAAGADGLWVIDQHVAHERILFEKVLLQMASGRVERQQLLIPLVVDLSPAQMAEFERVRGELDASGFEAEAFGPRSVAVKAAPAALGAPEIERVIFEILEIADKELRETTVDDLRREMAASIACRAAIKINTPLDARRIQWLLDELAATQFPMSCPHGRPIALRYATKEILKSFHRI
jgi:DNA mismatch repair protein MutL